MKTNELTEKVPVHSIKATKKWYAKSYCCKESKVQLINTTPNEFFETFTSIAGMLLVEKKKEMHDELELIYDEIDVYEQEDFLTSTELPTGGVSVKKGLVRRIETDTFRLTFVPDNKGVELYKIEVFENGKGLGTKLMMFMEQIVENLHEMKNMKGTIVLRPAGFGNTPTEVLRKWYNKLGYKRQEKSLMWALAV